MARKFESIQELRNFVDNFFKDEDMSESELYGRVTNRFSKLNYSLKDNSEHISLIEEEIVGLDNELQLLKKMIEDKNNDN